jgi:hypothetical protein
MEEAREKEGAREKDDRLPGENSKSEEIGETTEPLSNLDGM